MVIITPVCLPDPPFSVLVILYHGNAAAQTTFDFKQQAGSVSVLTAQKVIHALFLNLRIIISPSGYSLEGSDTYVEHLLLGCDSKGTYLI